MHTLSELQAAFASFLLARPGPADDYDLLAAVCARGVEPQRRLAIYKNNVYARLIEALADSFPAVERLVGPEFFRYAAIEYLTTRAPRESMLIAHGGRFADFLADFAPAATVPYLPDVARLEQLYLEAYHAEERVAASAAVVARWLAGDAGPAALALHPSARLLHARYPIARIWELNSGADPSNVSLSIVAHPEHLLIIRPAASVEVRTLHPGTYAALGALAAGHGLAAARAAAAASDPGLDLDAPLLALAGRGTFCLM